MPANRIGNSDWVVCRGDGGFAVADGEPEPMMSRFPQTLLGASRTSFGIPFKYSCPDRRRRRLTDGKTWSDITKDGGATFIYTPIALGDNAPEGANKACVRMFAKAKAARAR